MARCLFREMPILTMPIYSPVYGYRFRSSSDNSEQSAHNLMNKFGYMLEDYLMTRATKAKRTDEQKEPDQQASSEAKDDSSRSQPFPTFEEWINKMDQLMREEIGNASHKETNPKKNPKNEQKEVAKDSPPEAQLTNDFLVEVKASGFEPEDIRVKIKDGYITVEALRETEDQENGTYTMQKLNKSFKLPMNTDPDKVSCQMTEGLLTIRAKLPDPKPSVQERIVDIKQTSEAE